MSAPPTVSVVLPTRDRWQLVRRAAAAALRQEGVDVEVVIVDDGSERETARRLAELEEPGLRVVRHDASQGVARARNHGIAEARGEWVAFLDDDDLWSPQKLTRQLEAAADRDASFVYTGVIMLDKSYAVLGDYALPTPQDVLARLLSFNAIPAGASSVLARTEILRDLCGFDETFFQLADWDLWIRLAARTRAASCPEPLVGYLFHPENMLLTHVQNVLDEYDRLVEKHGALCREQGIEFDRVGFSRWVADGHRRAGRRVRAAGVYLRTGLGYRSGGNLLRAVGVLAGERVMAVGGTRPIRHPIPEPGWLEAYRPG